MPLTDQQIALLQEPLDPHLAARMSPDGKNRVSYIEGYVVIEQANRILGFGQWGYEVVREERDVDPDTGAGVYSAWVRVTVAGCEPVVELGDCTLLVGQGKRANAAQKSMARKGAVTDGMKRGLRHFGDQFGNALYSKDSEIHALIEQAEREDRQAQRQPAPRPTPPARTVTTPAGAVTTAPLDEAREMYPQIEAARTIYDEAASLLANDPAFAKAMAKPLSEQSPDEVSKTRDLLKRRRALIDWKAAIDGASTVEELVGFTAQWSKSRDDGSLPREDYDRLETWRVERQKQLTQGVPA